jgi:hypothetical protein
MSSCDKKQWKETVETKIKIESVNTSVNFGVNVLHIDTVIVNIESLALSGNRIQAENINLSETLNGEYLLTENVSQEISSFSVPQGTYESFLLTTKIGGEVNSIELRGTYTKANNTVKKVVLKLDYNQFLLNQMVENSSSPVSIDKDMAGEITLSIDPSILFNKLNPSYWNSANNSTINGQSGINISNNSNSSMYNEVHSQVGASLSVNFE